MPTFTQEHVNEVARSAVQHALDLYSLTSGMTADQVAAHFAASEDCRQNIYLLVAMQAKGSKYDAPHDQPRRMP